MEVIEKMVHKVLDKAQLALGRLIGHASRKDEEIVELWKSMVHSSGMKPGERILQLIAWDVQQGGVDLSEVRKKKRFEKVEKAFEEADLAQQISQLSAMFASKMMEKDMFYTQQIENLLAEIRKIKGEQEVKIKPLKEIENPFKSDPNRFVKK